MDLIRGFVSVGRRMSITLAADDLCVTQSAVSRQIRALEDLLGVRLLVRAHRSIAFTPEGERLFFAAEAALCQVEEATDGIRAARGRRPVTVSVPMGFAGLWLLPRVAHFQQQHPGIDLRISADPRLVDLRGEGVDLAVRYCPRAAAPRGALRLFGETLAPVAHPSLGTAPLERAEQIGERFLLEFDDARRRYLRWDDWLGARGWAGAKAKGMLLFNQYDQVIHAAVAGRGIALGRLELLGTMLADGRLVTLAEPRPLAEHGYAHWLVQGENEPRAEVLEVVQWVRAQAAAMQPAARLRATA